MAQLWKSKATGEKSERRDQTIALMLLVLAVIAVLLGDHIAFPIG